MGTNIENQLVTNLWPLKFDKIIVKFRHHGIYNFREGWYLKTCTHCADWAMAIITVRL